MFGRQAFIVELYIQWVIILDDRSVTHLHVNPVTLALSNINIKNNSRIISDEES